MSSTNNLGQNITTAINVLYETYQNLNLMFSEMDIIAEEEGFVSLSPKFLRWKSDSNTNGWLTNNFVKLYQLEDKSMMANVPDLREGYMFCVEIELGEEDVNYPLITLSKFTFDYRSWSRLPGVSDHWIFHNPFRDESQFNIDEKEGLCTSKPHQKTKKKYWGLQEAIGRSFPLLNVTSPETIRSGIFKGLLELSEV